MSKEYAVVTGSSSGMGMEFAKLLAKQGYNLVLVARRTERLEQLQKEILQANTIDIHVVSLDLSLPDSPDKLLAYAQINGLKVSVLINNAGFGAYGEFLNVPIEKTMEMLQLNMVTLTKLTYLFGNEMKKNGLGYILQVASLGAFQPSPYFSAYSATKAYVMLFSEAVDFEWKGSNVSITTLYPGATKTEFFDVAQNKLSPLVKTTLMTAEQVASIALKAMFNRERSIIPGIINKLSAFMTRFAPRDFATWSAARLMK